MAIPFHGRQQQPPTGGAPSRGWLVTPPATGTEGDNLSMLIESALLHWLGAEHCQRCLETVSEPPLSPVHVQPSVLTLDGNNCARCLQQLSFSWLPVALCWVLRNWHSWISIGTRRVH